MLKAIFLAPCVMSATWLAAALATAAASTGGDPDVWGNRAAIAALGIIVIRLIVVQGKMHTSNIKARERETERLEKAQDRSTDRIVRALELNTEETQRLVANMHGLRNALESVVGEIPWHKRAAYRAAQNPPPPPEKTR
jgi:hypothetical protein